MSKEWARPRPPRAHYGASLSFKSKPASGNLCSLASCGLHLQAPAEGWRNRQFQTLVNQQRATPAVRNQSNQRIHGRRLQRQPATRLAPAPMGNLLDVTGDHPAPTAEAIRCSIPTGVYLRLSQMSALAALPYPSTGLAPAKSAVKRKPLMGQSYVDYIAWPAGSLPPSAIAAA